MEKEYVKKTTIRKGKKNLQEKLHHGGKGRKEKIQKKTANKISQEKEKVEQREAKESVKRR